LLLKRSGDKQEAQDEEPGPMQVKQVESHPRQELFPRLAN
jgi:hypothetical protein